MDDVRVRGPNSVFLGVVYQRVLYQTTTPHPQQTVALLLPWNPASRLRALVADATDSEQDGATAQPHRWRWRGTEFVLWFVDGLSAVPCSVQQRCALTKTTCTQDKTPRPAALQRSRSAARSQKKHALPTPSLRLLHPSPGDHQCTFYFPHTIPGSHPHHAP